MNRAWMKTFERARAWLHVNSETALQATSLRFYNIIKMAALQEKKLQEGLQLLKEAEKL